MTLARLVFFLFFVTIIQTTGLAYFGADSIPQIVNPDTETINYCSDSVLVSPNITVKNIVFDESTDGMKVSVANYRKGEDILVYDTVNSLKYYWNDALGFLEIKGIASTLKYQEALRKVYYTNKAAIPNLQPRSFSISLLDADYLPQTKHFYKYIKNRGIKWSEAKAIADTMTYYGLKGYLTTITSLVENDFIWTKILGVGWIGANDAETEGTWKWVTGPEAGTVFWQGTFNGGPIGGQFSYWNNGEPNNVQKSWGADEDYAHVNANPNSIPKSWNDLSDEGDKLSPNGFYFPEGFIVEFGGFAGEPEMQLSATAKINLAKIAFSDVREHTICAGSPKEINLKAPPNSNYSYSWTPNENISSVTVSNPVVNPYTTTTYTSIGRLDFCTDTAYFLVNVNPLPDATWKGADTICKGNFVTMDPGVFKSYLWETGAKTQTINVSDEGWYSVRLTNEFNCETTDSSFVKWSVIPELDYSYFDTLVCGSKTATLNLVFKSGNASTQLVSLQPESATVTNANSSNPVVTVDKFGIYYFKIIVTDKYNCEFTDTLKIEFHNQPTALFQIDDAECEGYNLKLYYKGTTEEDAVFNWYSSDTLFFSGINADTMLIPLGYGSSNRSVALKINEKGCTDSLRLPVTVTPVLDFWATNPGGCTPVNVKFDYTATEKIANFYWEFGDSTNSTDEKPVHLYENKDTNDKKFDVSLKIVSIEGCENTGLKKDYITIHPIPTLDFDFKETDCNNETSVVNYVGSANDKDTFFWDLNSFLPAEIIANPGTTKNPLEFKRSSEPTVKIGLHVVSAFGCKTKPMEKTWKRKPVYEVDIVNVAGCPPLEPEFIAKTTDPVDKVNYMWNFGNGNTSQTDSTKHIYSQPDEKYTIQLVAKSDLTQCSDTVIYTDTVNVYPVPTAHFMAEPPNVIISNPIILFSNASENATAFEWYFGDKSALSDEENPEHRYNEMGLFDVQLTSFNSFGCIDTATQQVSVTFDKLFPPTAFSPNAIAEEDREFRIYSPGIASEGYQLLLFNRWGEIIFESNSQEKGWDGKMKNSNFAPTGVYNWVIQYIDFRGEKHKQQGSVTLLF